MGLGVPTDTVGGGLCPVGIHAVTEQRAAQRMLTKRTDRVILVLDNIHDPRVELAAMQCADYLGVLRIWRVEDVRSPRRNACCLS